MGQLAGEVEFPRSSNLGKKTKAFSREILLNMALLDELNGNKTTTFIKKSKVLRID